MDQKNGENEKYGRLKSFKLLNERMEKRRRKASMGRLISLIIALIVIILLWFWVRRMAL